MSSFGRQTCSDLGAGGRREWLLTDGLGGFAMGTASGLRTRRYHGLLVVATEPPIGRHLGLAALDPVLVLGDRRVELAAHEWADGTIAPEGHRHIARFDLTDGVPRWRWSVGGVAIEAELAMTRGRPAIASRWTVRSTGGRDRIGLELGALCTWRDVHGERTGWTDPGVSHGPDGFRFEDAYRVRGPGFEPDGVWYRGVHHREEAARGLAPSEDLWSAGRFHADLAAGESCAVDAWAAPLDDPPPPAETTIEAARARFRLLAPGADAVDAVLTNAADQFIVTSPSGPTVVAGYPWFGDWSRDTMTSYEGLFLETGRAEDGRSLLRAAAATVSEGMLANTADAGGTEYNTADGSLWFLAAIGRHVERTGDLDLGAELLGVIADIVDHHVTGTRFGIRVDADGLVTQGADGWALTWMDARVDGVPITQRSGKPVEVNALWIEGVSAAGSLAEAVGADRGRYDRLANAARTSFRRRFPRNGCAGLYDVVDGPGGDDPTVRPNQLLAVSRRAVGLDLATCESVVRAVEPLVTSIGVRSLHPDHPAYAGRHRGDSGARDAAYHQGTVWPWLIGPWVDALHATKRSEDATAALVGLEAHLDEWGLGSVSETADGDPPHDGTGCPFQAWSVAEMLRARRSL